MSNTARMREAWGPPCDTSLMVVRWLVNGVRLQYRRECQQAFSALAYCLLAYEYMLRPAECGAFNCRRITGGSGYSLHAYGVALDLNWNTNPYTNKLVTDMPPGLRREILRIRTLQGRPVFVWGGDWDNVASTPHGHYDAMHWEIAATPEELRAGIDWDTVILPSMTANRPALWPVCQLGDRHPVVGVAQRKLGLVGTQADGIFGPATEAAVRAHQERMKLKPDGVVAAGTWTSLLHLLPGDPRVSPVKLGV